MIQLLNFRRVLLSAVVIAFVASLVFAGTQAFFSDTETSTGNTFTAGALDLRVDSQAHFNNLICRLTTQDDVNNGFGDLDEYEWHADGITFADDASVPAQHYPQPGTDCTGTWEESDLIADALEFRFFNFDDLKPGDQGENTISLHVYNNDAWGCFLVDNVADDDNTCTEPESEVGGLDPECDGQPNVDLGANGAGELGSSLTFDSWIDDGTIPGFQCNHASATPAVGASCDEDPQEGDNILNADEQLFWDDEVVDEVAEGPFALSEVLSAAYIADSCTEATGNTDYGECHGFAEDGRMVGSATYYFGLAWNLPNTVGNEAQTDSLVADMIFEVEQHRNNPNFQCTEPDQEPQATLTLIKEVIGSSTPATDWTLTASGTSEVLSGAVGDGSITSAIVAPGTYDLSESGPGGFTASDWVCVGATGSTTSSVTLADGDVATCTITNTDLNNV